MLCCASMALAQSISREDARGIGVAENADGKSARFSFVANKATSGDHTFIGGRLELIMIERDARHAVGVLLPAVQRLVVVEHRTEFAGPGVLNVVDGHTIHHIPGMVVANAADLGVPTNDTDPADTIRVRFTPQNPTGRSFDFAGHVTHGDIVVSAHQ